MKPRTISDKHYEINFLGVEHKSQARFEILEDFSDKNWNVKCAFYLIFWHKTNFETCL